jgi:hypothetical protein
MKIEEFYKKHSETYHFRKSLKAGFISYLRVENDQAEVDEKTLIEKYKKFSGIDPTTGKPAVVDVHKNPTPVNPDDSQKSGKGKSGKGKKKKDSDLDDPEDTEESEDSNLIEPDLDDLIQN